MKCKTKSIKMNLTLFLFLLCVLLTTPAPCLEPNAAEDINKKWGIGLFYPGISLKYLMPNSNNALELRMALSENLIVLGGRFYSNFFCCSPFFLYWGGEGDIAFFTGDPYSGLAIEGFMGAEFFLTERISFSADIGPAYVVAMTQGDAVGGLDWIVNLGIIYYF